MIQHIDPHRFNNEYKPVALPSDNSPVLCFSGRSVLIKTVPVPEGKIDNIRHTEGLSAASLLDAEFPIRSMFGQDDDIVFAFTMDDTDYYINLSEKEHIIPGYKYTDLRNLRGCVENHISLILYTGIHLFQWYDVNRYCGKCSAPLMHSPSERALCCPVCGKTFYPQIMPAVIVGVINNGRLLATKYRTGFDHYALIAGFCEIGESLEETVAREVMEESGLKVKNIRYYGSQPWGIAQDLLAGFYCDVDGDSNIKMDTNELKLAEWKRPEEIVLQPDFLSLTNEMMLKFKNGEIH
ncbi:MAG: NAD(+) diphosphatase [Parasporobacterium sp.]|nr:NAD(+) diphosphatase [Parasporobacterium sp.]